MTAEEIKAEAKSLSQKFYGRYRTEEWENEKKEAMLKVVLTFKVDE